MSCKPLCSLAVSLSHTKYPQTTFPLFKVERDLLIELVREHHRELEKELEREIFSSGSSLRFFKLNKNLQLRDDPELDNKFDKL